LARRSATVAREPPLTRRRSVAGLLPAGCMGVIRLASSRTCVPRGTDSEFADTPQCRRAEPAFDEN